MKDLSVNNILISGQSPVVQSDIGGEPNQIPLNKDLGSLAYMNAPQIEDINVDTLELREIAAEISDTAVDVFVYDTRKDSDGGAWRKRTQHTSWYNEELNTETRGSRREFPAVAVIVAEAGKITIYDGDDPDLPMWMVFTTTGTVNANAIVKNDGYNISTVGMLNGLLVCGVNYNGGFEINFASDKCHRRNPSVYAFGGNIASRNGGMNFITLNATDVIVNTIINDVAMTVLPNAPIDSETGLPIPTIAVATDGGVSVIRDDGSVVDITSTNVPTIYDIAFTDDYKVMYRTSDTSGEDSYIHVFEHEILSGDVNYTYPYSSSEPTAIDYAYNLLSLANNVDARALATKGEGFTVGAVQNGAIQVYRGSTDFDKHMTAHTTSSYNTGWMPGDIKLATLSDTKIEKVGVNETTELVTNGGFDADSDWTNSTSGGGATGWTIASGVATSSGSAGYMIQAKGTVGTMITITYEVTSYTSGDLFCVFGSGGSGLLVQGSTSLGTHSITGIVTDNSDIGFYSLGTLSIDNASITKTGELVTNGIFDDGTTGWDDNSLGTGSVVYDSGTGTVKLTRIDGSNNGVLAQGMSLLAGKRYVLSFDTGSIVTSNIQIRGYTSSTTITGSIIENSLAISANSSFMTTFVAEADEDGLEFRAVTGTNTYIYLDNISVRLAEDDRSVNDNGLQVFGEITKSPVAPGADLVAYSGFSTGNYLMQPYNSDLDFGTGDFCVMGWAKAGTDGTTLFVREHKSSDDDGSILVFQDAGTYHYYIRADGNGFWNSWSTGFAYSNNWAFLTYLRKSGTIYGYVNGQLKFTASSEENVSNSEAVVSVGNRSETVAAESQAFGGSLALWRISSTTPTDAQIAKIYRDEKPLFQDGAQATLYGTSDAVTALAYDDKTELLHVGTSGGRSDFSGLRRINNTTTAVTTSISASNNLIAEQ